MNWIEYKAKFLEKANKEHKSEEYCDKWIEYAEKLVNNNMPIIFNQEHLCKLLGYSPLYVYAASNSPYNFYRHYEIPKKNGGVREISEPLPNLKEIQRWILDNILYCFKISPYAKAYIREKSIKDNVKFHRRQKKVLTLDIKKFYDNLTDWMVYQLFLEKGYNEDVAMMLTRLCCLNGCLPQGAPTSSALSNILMKNFDYQVGALCKEKKIRFTRYADDMVFSGDFDENEIICVIRGELKRLNLKLNDRKTRVSKQGQQQLVTGIVVNSKTQLPKSFRKNIRKNVYYIKRYGLESHLEYIGEERKNYLEHLYGQINYALFINPTDRELRQYREIIRNYMNYNG